MRSAKSCDEVQQTSHDATPAHNGHAHGVCAAVVSQSRVQVTFITTKAVRQTHWTAVPSLCKCCRLCPPSKQAHQLHASRSCSFALSANMSRLCRHRQRVVQAAMQLDNRELLVGDCLSLVSFCLYKQVKSRMQRSAKHHVGHTTSQHIWHCARRLQPSF